MSQFPLLSQIVQRTIHSLGEYPLTENEFPGWIAAVSDIARENESINASVVLRGIAPLLEHIADLEEKIDLLEKQRVVSEAPTSSRYGAIVKECGVS